MPIRLQLMWVTLATLAALVLIIATRPAGQVVNAEFAGNLAQFAESLDDTSISALNQLRASLAADMVFLVAYGLLLRQSLLFARAHRRTGLVRHAAVAAMVADATENVAALNILRRVEQSPAGVDLEVPSWIFNVMNTASVAKWALVGLVLVFLAWRWRPLIQGFKEGALRRVALATMASFAVGGLASLIVAVTIFTGPGGGLRKTSAALVFLGLGLGGLLQFRLLDLIGVALRLLYLARVPILVLLIAAGFGPIALGTASPLLGAILDVPNPTGIAIVTVAAIVLAFACVTQINLVRAYGAQRTFDETLDVLQDATLGSAIRWTALLAALSLLFCIGLSSLRISLGLELVGFAAGLVGGTLFLFVLEWIALLMSAGAGKAAPQLGIPFASIPLLAGWLKDAYGARPPALLAELKAVVHRWSIAGRLFGLSSGYIDSNRHLLPGHTFALTQLVLSVLVYVALIFAKLTDAVTPESSLVVPTAASVVLLLLLNSWGLSSLTFFFDRYRIPLITVLVVLTAATGSTARTDYVVETEAPKGHYELATPGDVLGRFRSPLIVTAAGGGIQAGAWAARVLQGLDQELQDRPVTLPDRLALVSGVSGGSMGALYYGAYRDAPSNGTSQSLQSSLDEIASALVGTDHLRRVFSWPARPDRGAALEHSWAARLPAERDHSLRAWSDRVRTFARQGDATPFPAFLFNTTVVETGQPAAFVTTQFPSHDYRRDTFAKELKQSAVVESVNRLFDLSTLEQPQSARDVGLQMATAARLSATFPYVSPATTLNIPGSKPYHLVDGGYYDNYGLAAVTQWLDDALEQLEPKPEQPLDIVVVIAQGLMASSDDLLKGDKKEGKPKVKEPPVENHGWAWQLVAPPAAFLATRSFGQWAGGMQALQLLKEKWALKNVTIRPVLLDYPADKLAAACRAAPLSWKLSLPQQQCVEDAWKVVVADGSALSEITR